MGLGRGELITFSSEKSAHRQLGSKMTEFPETCGCILTLIVHLSLSRIYTFPYTRHTGRLLTKHAALEVVGCVSHTHNTLWKRTSASTAGPASGTRLDQHIALLPAHNKACKIKN